MSCIRDADGAGPRGAAVSGQFRWSHNPGHPLRESLLRPRAGQTIVDLGCGLGIQVALLTRDYRLHVIGVDHSEKMVTEAQSFFRHETAEYVHAEAHAWLTSEVSYVDAIYSRFGAVWFSDPDLLLPVIADRIRPGGRFVFSHTAPGSPEFDVPRWDLPFETWFSKLKNLGFTEIVGGPLPCRGQCAYPDCPGVMIVDCTR